MHGKLGALTKGHRNRIREILDATSIFRDEEVAIALELFDETFAEGPARNRQRMITLTTQIGMIATRLSGG